MGQSKQQKAIAIARRKSKISPTKQKELSTFMVKRMLEKNVPIDNIIGGLQLSGVPNKVIKQAFDKNSNLVRKKFGSN